MDISIVISGSVERVDNGYLVSTNITLAGGRQIAVYTQFAADADDLPAAITLLSFRLRERFGECADAM